METIEKSTYWKSLRDSAGFLRNGEGLLPTVADTMPSSYSEQAACTKWTKSSMGMKKVQHMVNKLGSKNIYTTYGLISFLSNDSYTT